MRLRLTGECERVLAAKRTSGGKKFTWNWKARSGHRREGSPMIVQGSMGRGPEEVYFKFSGSAQTQFGERKMKKLFVVMALLGRHSWPRRERRWCRRYVDFDEGQATP